MSIVDYTKKKLQRRIIEEVGDIYSTHIGINKVSKDSQHIAYELFATKLQKLMTTYKEYTKLYED